MRIKTTMILGLALMAASTASTAGGGGCLAGRYQYFDAAGKLVGGETVGCPMNSAWGQKTARAVFAAGCNDAS